ncbi:MAG: class I SAM-dependent methyltransferase [Gemmatimonadaceae bacterium]|nr:class I SAM-dependent methyltransferase [Gloeobacterales cyanobacterium ES-bin-141]
MRSDLKLSSQLVSRLLAVKPLADLARKQARNMMIRRAESIGVSWTEQARALRSRDWSAEVARVENPGLVYPQYYLKPFHAYERGNLCWEAATEVEVAALAVHARIWPDAGAQGDARLRRGYHEIVSAQLAAEPRAVLDMGCSVGMSTFALQQTFPRARVTGLDLSPYFLAVASHSARQRRSVIDWVHGTAECSGLESATFDLVSIFLVMHELPGEVSRQVLREAHRLLRPGGHLAIMDMNPRSAIYATMPPYILTLLKSTEPYLDEYFGLDLERAMVDSGFEPPTLSCNTPRHRTLVSSVSPRVSKERVPDTGLYS